MREFPLPQEILKVFERQPGKTFRLRELVVELGLRSSQARDLKNALKDLSRHRRIVYLKKNHFALVGRIAPGSLSSPAALPPRHGREGAAAQPLAGPESRVPNPMTARLRGANVVTGRLIGHRDGYGFVVPDAPLAGSDQDIYVSSDGMGSAMNGDRVEVQVRRSARSAPLLRPVTGSAGYRLPQRLSQERTARSWALASRVMATASAAQVSRVQPPSR